MRRPLFPMFRALIIMVLTVLALAPPAPVRAHASLIESLPADGQVVAQTPALVRLRFNEPVSPLVIRLIGKAGEIAHGGVRTTNQTVEVDLPPGLPEGAYAVSYRIVSADGHPVGGSIVFSVGRAADAPQIATGRSTIVESLLWLSRLAMYAGLFFGAGGAFFLAWMTRGMALRSASLVVKATIGLGLVGTVLSIGLQGLDALDAPLAHVWRQTVWRAGLETTFGITATAAVIALATASGSLLLHGSVGRALAAVAMLGVGLSLAASGHASLAGPQWLTRPAVFIHAVCLAFWIGAFVPLLVLLRHRANGAKPIIEAWSTGAVVSVALLAITGTILALVQVPRLGDLYGTAYGCVLLAKLAAVAALLALAAANRLWLTPGLDAAGSPAKVRLGRSVAAELGLAVLILGLVGLWRFTPPPRALPTVIPPARASASIHSDRAMVEIRLEPTPSGAPLATISLMNPQHRPLEAKEVTLSLSNPAAGIEPIERKAVRLGPGEWQVPGIALPVAGPWLARVDALVTDFEKLSLEAELAVSP
jgi:copper transport protein